MPASASPCHSVVLSLGMGIDSSALLVRWIKDPSSRSFDLKDLVVVTAMTGDEHAMTCDLVERYLLPLLRRHSIRYVQICRKGQEKKHGYVVLSDTRCPDRMYMRGPWRLSDEMRAAGTLPSVRQGRRWCSERAKGEVIDWWVADHMQPGYVHVVGFAAEEPGRAVRDAAARREKETKGQVVPCQPYYPLIEDWNWDRQKCAAYLRETFDVEWARSCCRFCPFQSVAGSRDELVARWKAQPEAGADAIELEYTALAMNPRIGAFGVGRTAADLAKDHHLDEALAIALSRINQSPAWDVLEIRRFFDAKDNDPNAKGQAWRSVRVAATGSRDAMVRWIQSIDNATTETDSYGITRAWRQRRPPAGEKTRYPAIEWLWVVVPHGVQAKQKPGFEKKWTALHMPTLF